MTEDYAELINKLPRDGWLGTMGLRITRATVDEVCCEWDVAPMHLQGFGIVHGGVHCGVIETLASVGAYLVAAARGQVVVGLENHTSFIRAVRSGRLRGVARPVTRGRASQVWEGSIHDADDKLVARGVVRLLCLPGDQPIAGEVPGVVAPEAGDAGRAPEDG